MVGSSIVSSSRGGLWAPLAWAVVAGAVTLGLVASASIALQQFYAGRVYPGVRVGSLPVGGLTREEVAATLGTQVQAYTAGPIVFVHGEREWRPPAEEVGIAVDLEAMIDHTLAYGRKGGFLGGVRTSWRAVAGGQGPAVPLHANLDQKQLEAHLGAIAAEIDRQPVDASLTVRDGRVQVGGAAPGQRLDVARTAAQVRPPTDLATPQRVTLVVGPVPPSVPDERAQEARAVAEAIVSKPLVLRQGERFWTLSPTALGAMIQVQRVEGSQGAALTAALDRTKVAAQVRAIAAQIDQPAQDALMRLEGGRAVPFRESRVGRRLDQAAAVEAVLAQAATDRREIALSVTEVKPAVSASDAVSIVATALLATGQSTFRGSAPERANNIRVAATRLNGVVIPPGGVFSFLAALGPITRENGYQEGLTIQGDATVPGIGGGVCQVSTTAFRAAFWAGLPIVERHQHTYRVGYYEQDGSPVGFDAAVYDPGVDLKFRNDSKGYIVIQTAVDVNAGTLAFRFYGTPTGRDVKLTGPTIRNRIPAGPRLPDGSDRSLPKGVRKQVEWAADGLDVTIGRIVTEETQGLRRDSFFSRFVPWREKWVVGTG